MHYHCHAAYCCARGFHRFRVPLRPDNPVEGGPSKAQHRIASCFLLPFCNRCQGRRASRCSSSVFCVPSSEAAHYTSWTQLHHPVLNVLHPTENQSFVACAHSSQRCKLYTAAQASPGALVLGFLPQLLSQTAHAVPCPPPQRTPQPDQGPFLLLSMRYGKALAGGILEILELTPALNRSSTAHGSSQESTPAVAAAAASEGIETSRHWKVAATMT